MPVRHSPPRSLAQRIMLSFALLVTFVAGFYAFALYQSIEFTEQQLISGILRDEVARREVCRKALLVATSSR